MPKIIDCFIFYNELKMLKFRLTELYNTVDFFIVVESTYTFSGKKKELFFENHKNEFSEFKDKIIHVIVEDMPNNDNAWYNEFHQRKSIDRGIKMLNLNDKDIIIITDCDEIPNPKVINQIKVSGITEHIHTLEMEMYYYNLECRGKDYIWQYAKLLTYKTYNKQRDPQYIRNHGNMKIQHGGWHFSYFGDVSFIKNKIKHFSHQELNSEKYLNDVLIQTQINNCDDLFFRDNKNVHNFQKYPLSENKNLPKNYKMLL